MRIRRITIGSLVVITLAGLAGASKALADEARALHADGCGESCEHGTGPTFDREVVAVSTAGDPSRGPADAPITIVEFADFECPYCARALPTLAAIEAAHPGQVRVVYKEQPLPTHARARPAAKAALAAGALGHFWDYHDALYAHPDALDRASLERYAKDLGLDPSAFAARMADQGGDTRIDSDLADATALGVSGTPTFFVNGHRTVGAQPLSVFEAAIAAR